MVGATVEGGCPTNTGQGHCRTALAVLHRESLTRWRRGLDIQDEPDPGGITAAPGPHGAVSIAFAHASAADQSLEFTAPRGKVICAGPRTREANTGPLCVAVARIVAVCYFV